MIECDFCGQETRLVDGHCGACGRYHHADVQSLPADVSASGLSASNTAAAPDETDVITGSNYKRDLWFGN